MNSFFQIPGQSITEKDLTNPYTVEFLQAVKSNPFVKLICIKYDESLGEIIDIVVEVEIPQRPKNDIKNLERIAVVFDKKRESLPKVLALRNDFPLVPHLLLTGQQIPRSLCLYEQTFHEIVITWSGFNFLERIRDWLRDTAKGTLHSEDQPLEPLLYYNNSYLILPEDIFSKTLTDIITVEKIISDNVFSYLPTTNLEGKSSKSNENIIITLFAGKPQKHGIIESVPSSISDLNSFLKKADINLVDELRERLKVWHSNNAWILQKRLIILIALPKYRADSTRVEGIELRAFLSKKTLSEVGIDLGVYSLIENITGLLIPYDCNKSGDSIQIEMLNVFETLTKNMAATYNGVHPSNIAISAIGLGSIGSAIYSNLLRQGFAKWVLIDHDILLPHNLSRHILYKSDLGIHKVDSLKKIADDIYEKSEIQVYKANVLVDFEKNEQLKKDIENSNLILDFSASVAVARSIALDIKSIARRISFFMNPKASELVIIAEDKSREHTLDSLEMQYYKGIIENDQLEKHLEPPNNRMRTGYSCRDLSSIMEFEKIAIYSGICTSIIKELIENEKPLISIWRIDKSNVVERIDVPISAQIRESYGEWTIVYTKSFIEKIFELRKAKLPVESGGVLLGSYDTFRHIIYVIDTIPSPPDSKEWPTIYIRGIKGLKNTLDSITARVNEQVTYIGEWHSHPQGCQPKPSRKDLIAFSWLTEVMNESGKPALMLIAGEGFEFYLGKMVYEPD